MMTSYLPFAPLFCLVQPNFSQEIRCLRVITDTYEWKVPPLSVGLQSLQEFALTDIWQYNKPQAHFAYNLLLEDVIISSESGIIQTKSGLIIEDSLFHTRSEIDLYCRSTTGEVALLCPVTSLAGCWLSLLLSNQDNYFHFLLMNLGRLFQINPEEAKMIHGVLVPSHFTTVELRALEIGLQLAFGDQKIEIRSVGRGESLSVNTLFFAWNAVCINFAYTHSGVVNFLRQMITLTNSDGTIFPTHFYIDRRGSINRPLINEDELIDALEERGFAIVQLENLTFDEQVLLFHQAKYIISAHGAGLTNIVFSQPETKIIEIMPHTLMHWCYRQLAMINDLSYDCIISHSNSEQQNILPTWASHLVSVTSVIDALDT